MENRSALAPTPESVNEEDRIKAINLKRKLEAEQAAFDELMSYSVEQAYGVDNKE